MTSMVLGDSTLESLTPSANTPALLIFILLDNNHSVHACMHALSLL
jgi:hypothetical protein